MPRAWYAYNGGTPVLGCGSWNYIATSPFLQQYFECVGTAELCVIYAYYSGSIPPVPNPQCPLTTRIRFYIALALTTSANTIPQFGKPYLYKKSL